MALDPLDEHVTNPFEIFPVPIWEAIIDNLEDIHDIKTILKAFPPLQVLSELKHFSWFISDVMPIFFYKFLHPRDIKSCRIVSKRWKRVVDTCLESNPDNIPYKVDVVAETFFNYHPCYSIISMKRFIHAGLFANTENEKRKLNPFPGRNVYIFMEDETYLDDPSAIDHYRHYNYTLKLTKVIPSSKIFGHHIWHIKLSLPYISYPNEESILQRLLHPLFQCLSYLPNLKSLNFMALALPKFELTEEHFEQIHNFLNLPFKLEALDIRLRQIGTGDCTLKKDINRHFLRAFINHKHLKKLTFQSLSWNSDYANMIPNLVELSLRVFSLTLLEKVLYDLKSCPIKKLHVVILLKKMCVEEILKALAEYPFEYLYLEGESLAASNRNNSKNNTSHLLTSVKFLRIGIDKLLRGFGFLFLESLPCLEYLTIEAKRIVKSQQSQADVKENQENRSMDKFLASVYNLFQNKEIAPNNFAFIWKQLPKLKMLTIRDFTHTYQYARESQNSVFCTACPPH